MRRTVLLAGVLLSVVALGSDSPKEYDDRTEVAGIEGTWRLKECTLNGEQLPLGQRLMVMTLRGGILTFDLGDGHIDRGTYRIDPAGKLPHFDRVQRFGPFPCVAGKCIYQIDGDTLRIAGFRVRRTERPRGFDDENAFIETYKRVK